MVAKNAKNLGRPGQQIKKKSKIDVFELSGHRFQRYIMHSDLKNRPGLIFEVPGPQNLVKRVILRVFVKIFGGFFWPPRLKIDVATSSSCAKTWPRNPPRPVPQGTDLLDTSEQATAIYWYK